jgi:hypothetical protein
LTVEASMSDDVHPEDTTEFSRNEAARLKALDLTPETIATELAVIRERLRQLEAPIALGHGDLWHHSENLSRAISRIDRLSNAITKRRA